MAIKQTVAVNALQEAACELIKTSLCAVDGGWLALVNTKAVSYTHLTLPTTSRV